MAEELNEAPVLESAIDQAQKASEVVEHTVIDTKQLPDSFLELTIEIPTEAWTKNLDTLFAEWRKQARIEGFRQGKAPMALVRKRFEADANNDLLARLLGQIVAKYEADNKLVIYGQPSILDAQIKSGEPVKSVIRMEVKPTVEALIYKGLEAKADKVAFGEADVDDRIEMMRRYSATFKSVDAAYEGGNGLKLDIKEIDAKGRTVRDEKDAAFDRPASTLPKRLIAAFEGKKAGDLIELSVNTETASPQPHKFTVEIKEVTKLTEPELSDEFAKDRGYEDLNDMKAKFNEMMSTNAVEMQDEESFEALMVKIIEAHDFQVPPSMRASLAREMWRQDMFQMRQGQYVARLNDAKTQEEYSERLMTDALDQAKAYLLIESIAEKESLEATDADITSALEKRAEREGRKPLAIRAALEKRREWEQFVKQVTFEKVRKFLLENNKVVLVEPKKEEAPAAE